MPGNNDAHHLPQIAAEFTLPRGISGFLAAASGDHAVVRMCGYSAHQVGTGVDALTVLAGRPCAMGGDEFSFAEQIARVHGVSDMQQSRERLRELVDQAQSPLLILAHNGPTGLGEKSNDMFGRDFHPDAGDWGDSDTRDLIDYALSTGNTVRAVVAGHMHQATHDGGRPWMLEKNGVLYINAARVPRIFATKVCQVRYHIALDIDGDNVTATEVFIED